MNFATQFPELSAGQLVQLERLIREQVIGESGKGHIPDEMCCNTCEMKELQRHKLKDLIGGTA